MCCLSHTLTQAVQASSVGMGIVKVLTVLLLLSIRYFNGILIGTFCYLYTYMYTYTYMYEIYISMID